MTDGDYLRAIAKGYANSFVDAWREHYEHLNDIAKTLDLVDQLDEAITRKLKENRHAPQERL